MPHRQAACSYPLPQPVPPHESDAVSQLWQQTAHAEAANERNKPRATPQSLMQQGRELLDPATACGSCSHTTRLHALNQRHECHEHPRSSEHGMARFCCCLPDK